MSTIDKNFMQEPNISIHKRMRMIIIRNEKVYVDGFLCVRGRARSRLARTFILIDSTNDQK